MQQPIRGLASVTPLFLILFIDGMGLSLLFPILNGMIIDTTSHFLAPSVSLHNREFLYGLVVGIYMLCWFFGAVILGDVSDVAGRKKALMACLIGAGLGYMLSGLAANMASLPLLIAGRIIAGLTAGSQPIAQAAIVDVSDEQHKARNIGFILLSISLGFVLGPLIGGVLSDKYFSPLFGFSTPLYFAALISFINAILLQGFFKETFIPTGPLRIRFDRALRVFASAFSHHKIWLLSIVLLIFIFGWANFYCFIPLYVHEQYGYDELSMSLFMAVMGIGFALSCSFLVDYCVQRFDNYMSVVMGAVLAVIAVVAMLIFRQDIMIVWVLVAVVGMAVCLSYSILLTLFSDAVGPDEQGWVMGVTGSIMALCFGLTSLLMGAMVEVGVQLPMWLSIGGLAVSGLLLLIYKLGARPS